MVLLLAEYFFFFLRSCPFTEEQNVKTWVTSVKFLDLGLLHLSSPGISLHCAALSQPLQSSVGTFDLPPPARTSTVISVNQPGIQPPLAHAGKQTIESRPKADTSSFSSRWNSCHRRRSNGRPEEGCHPQHHLANAPSSAYELR